MKNLKTVVIDTNLLVRFVTADDPLKAQAVRQLLRRAVEGHIRILIPVLVIAELVWVLENSYKMEVYEIAEFIESILNTPGVEVEEKNLLGSVLKLYQTKKIDFLDAWIIEYARVKEVKVIYSYDRKHFKDLPGIDVKEP